MDGITWNDLVRTVRSAGFWSTVARSVLRKLWWALRQAPISAILAAVAIYLYQRRQHKLSAKTIGEKLVAAFATAPVTTGDGSAESILPNSDILPGTDEQLPKCLSTVIVPDPSNSSTYLKVGNAVRIGDGVIIPQHVLAVHREAWLLRGEKYVKLDLSGRKHICPDIDFIPVPTGDLSNLGCAIARSANVSDKTMATAWSTICSGMPYSPSYYSIGEVANDSTVGLLQYTGSTRKGFSGGVYLLGNKVAGIHLRCGPSGSQHNVGVALAYVEAIIKRQFVGQDEDTAEWLLSLVKSKRARYVDSGSDYYVFETSGRYYTVDADDYDQAYMDDQNEEPYEPFYGADQQEQTLLHRGQRRQHDWADQYEEEDRVSQRDSRRGTQYGSDSEEAADDLVLTHKYKEDHFLSKRSPAGDLSQPEKQMVSDTNKKHQTTTKTPFSFDPSSVEVPRLVTPEVISRITQKSEAVSYQKFWNQEREVLIKDLEECSTRFRLAGSDLSKHEQVKADYDALTERIVNANVVLKALNVAVTRLSASTAEEKKQAQHDAASRQQQRKAQATQQVVTALSKAPVEAAQDAENESAALKHQPSIKPRPGGSRPRPPKQTSRFARYKERSSRDLQVAMDRLSQLEKIVKAPENPPGDPSLPGKSPGPQ